MEARNVYTCLHSRVLWNCTKECRRARDRIKRAPVATLPKINCARSGERGLKAGAVLQKAAHEASHFAEIVQVSHLPPTFCLEGFQAYVEIPGAMQAHPCFLRQYFTTFVSFSLSVHACYLREPFGNYRHCCEHFSIYGCKHSPAEPFCA